MTTALVQFPSPLASKPLVQPRRNAAPSPPAVYIGTLPGFRDLPAIDLYNLLVPVGEHPVGSTVSHRTLERHGYRLPVVERRFAGEPLAC